MTSFAALLLTASFLSAAPDDKALTGDVAKFQGEWTAKVGPEQNIEITFQFTKQKVKLKGEFNGQTFEIDGEFQLDEKASPKRLDWTKFTSPNGEDVKDNLAIYKFDGDKLIVCAGGPGNDRPSEFKAGEGGPPNLTTFVKKKAEKPKTEPAKSDVTALAGTWKAKTGPDKDREVVVTYKGNTIEAKVPGENGVIEIKGEFSINENASPKTIDFSKFKNKDGEAIEDVLGLYKLEGDSLTLCAGSPGAARPTEFKAGEGVNLWTFTKQK